MSKAQEAILDDLYDTQTELIMTYAKMREDFIAKYGEDTPLLEEVDEEYARVLKKTNQTIELVLANMRAE